MKAGVMDRTALLTALQPVEGMQEIVVPKSGGTEFRATEGEGLTWHPEGYEDSFKVGREAAVQALRHVPGLGGAAVTGHNAWPGQLLIEPLNWWYQNGEGDARALVNGDGEVLAFTKRAEVGIQSPTRLLEAVTETLEEIGIESDSLYFDKVRVSLDKVSFAVITEEHHDLLETGKHEFIDEKEGIVLDAGIMVFASPTGEAHTEVSPYLNLLRCYNGMISPVAMERYTVKGGDGGSIYQWAREMTFNSWDAIDGELDALRKLTDIPVEGHVHDVLADIFERHHVPAGLRQDIAEAAVEEADGTLFGIAQAFNSVANGMEDVAGLRHLLMVTGDIAHQTERCVECLRALS